MRYFYLEFIRKGLKVDQVHFVPVKKGHLFKLPNTIGPFIVNTRHALEAAQKMLTDMHLSVEGKWAYDPYDVISNQRVENVYYPFFHESRPKMEKVENGGHISASVQMEVETPHPTEKGLKRGRDKLNCLENDVGNEDKKANTME